MKNVRNEPLVGVSYRIPGVVRNWINSSAAEQDRSANWLVIQILTQAYVKAQQQPGAVA